MNFFTSRFSHHPERYIEIFGVLRKYELHHIIAKFMLSHRHAEEDDDGLLLLDHQEDDDHAEGLAKALEELGLCFIKLGQLMSTRPDLLPADYIAALSRLQSTVTPVPSDKIIPPLSKASWEHPLPSSSNRSTLYLLPPPQWPRYTAPHCGMETR